MSDYLPTEFKPRMSNESVQKVELPKPRKNPNTLLGDEVLNPTQTQIKTKIDIGQFTDKPKMPPKKPNFVIDPKPQAQ